MGITCAILTILNVFIFNNIFVPCTVLSNEINLPQGKVRGLRSYSDNYIAFLGIPYASVKDRFQEPGPPPQWNTTFNAVRGSVKCKQLDTATQRSIGQEDCLVLNIFTPIGSQIRSLSVIIYIYGGGFHYGNNSDLVYNPKYLIRKDIIVVTINYRLGAFGFLCLQTPEVPGNLGLKDQVAAIHWVKNNIENFGGNPDSITLYGQSVGAASISYLLLSEQTKGLFQNVIISSGSLLVPYVIDNNPVATASTVAAKLGYKTNNTDELFNIYRNSSADDIIKASFFEDKNDPIAPYVFRPCIDNGSDSLVKARPREIINSTLIDRNINIIIGYNNKEGIKWAERFDYTGLRNLNNDFSRIIPENIIFASEEERLAFVDDVKQFYFENKTIDRTSYDNLIDYLSDSIIMYPSAAMTKYFLRSNISVYNYYFAYDSYRNLKKKKTSLAMKRGASHGDELYYIYDPIYLRLLPPTPSDAAVIDTMSSSWTNLAKTGNPSTQKVQWIKSEKDNLRFLVIGKNTEMISVPGKERLLFWKAIYAKYKAY